MPALIPDYLNNTTQVTVTQMIPKHFLTGMNDKIYNSVCTYIYIYISQYNQTKTEATSTSRNP